MLFMVGTNATIVRTAKVRGGMRRLRILRCLIVIPDLLVIINIVSNEYFLKSVFRTMLRHEHVTLFEDNFRADRTVALDTQTLCVVVIDVVTRLVHARQD